MKDTDRAKKKEKKNDSTFIPSYHFLRSAARHFAMLDFWMKLVPS